MNAYILEDAAGKFWQYIDPDELPTADPGMPGAINSVGTYKLGGWYTIDCHPVAETVVTHPVTVKWTRDRTGVVDLDFYGHYSEARSTR